MVSNKRTDSSVRMAFAPDILCVSDANEDVPGIHNLTHRTSQFIAWYRCHIQGCHVVQKTCEPRKSLLGGLSYKTTWWLR